MIALLFAAAIQAANSAPPCLAIFWLPGMTWTPVSAEVEIAVWPDGRVIWRDTPVGLYDAERKLRTGRYWEGKVSENAVREALADLRKSGAMSIGTVIGNTLIRLLSA